MASTIDTSQLDEFYPAAGKNQSSQQFRTNFAVIKDGLSKARKEISDIHNKSISIIGDATGSSGNINSGNSNPTPINLVLSNTGVSSGTYDTSINNISLTVDTKGRILSAISTPKTTYPVIGTHVPSISNKSISPNSGTNSVTIPTFTLNEYGQVVATSSTVLSGFGLVSHDLQKGSLIVGDGSNKSTIINTPSVSPSETWMLCVDNAASNGVSWKKMPDITGSVTSVSGANGIDVNNINMANPIVQLDIPSLEEFVSSESVDNIDDKLIIYDDSDNSTRKISREKFLDGANVLSQLSDDITPTLGGDLNVNGNEIVSSALSNIVLDGQKWPKTDGSSNNVITTDGNGNLYWENPNNLVTIPSIFISGSNGIITTPSAGITTTGNISVDFASDVEAKAGTISNKSISPLTLKNATSNYVRILSENITLWVRPDGNDNNNGAANTPTSAFRTISGAWTNISANLAGSATFSIDIRLGIPGTYAGNCFFGNYNGIVNVIGDTNNPSGYIVTNIPPTGGTPAGCISAGFGTTCNVVGVTALVTPANVTGTTNIGFGAYNYGTLSLTNCRMSLTGNASLMQVYMLNAGTNGLIRMSGSMQMYFNGYTPNAPAVVCFNGSSVYWGAGVGVASLVFDSLPANSSLFSLARATFGPGATLLPASAITAPGAGANLSAGNLAIMSVFDKGGKTIPGSAMVVDASSIYF